MVVTVAGTNSFALQQALRTATQQFLAEYGEMGVERLDGDEASYERIAEAVQGMSFLAPKKLIILKNPGAQKEFTERIETLLGGKPDTNEVYIVEQKLDKRTAYYKWLKKHTDFQEYSELDERQLAQWAVGAAQEQGSKLGISDANYLVHRIGTNQQRLYSELQKLALHSEITRELIDELTEATPQSKIFDLLDAAFHGKTSSALELYHEQRSLRVEPQEIIAMIGWQLRQVALAKTVQSHDLVREGKVSPYSANKAQAIAGRLTLAKIRQLVYELTMLDAKSKRVPIDLDEALQDYILRLA